MTGFLQPDDLSLPAMVQLASECADGLFQWDPDTDQVRWSRGILTVLGYDEIPARCLEDVRALLHPGDLADHDALLSQSITTRSPYLIEVRLRRADQSFAWVRARGFWVSSDDGERQFLLGVLDDITAVRDAHERARRSEAQFRTFLDNCPVAVYMKDAEHRHVYGNRRAARIVGVPLERFIGCTVDDIADAETARAVRAVDDRVLKHGEVVNWSGTLRNEDGGARYILDKKFPIVDVETGAPMLGGFGIDITRERLAQEAAARAQRLDALGKLVGGISHDFNNLLAVVVGNADMLAEEALRPDARAFVEAIRAAAQTGAGLTRQLLAFSRQAPMKTVTVDIGRLVSEMERMLRRALNERIQIETVTGGGLWPIQADPAMVESAILNLGLNAQDAMPDGGRLTIETRNMRLDHDYVAARGEPARPGRYVMLAVTDTGTGMTPEVLERAFEPFFTTRGEAGGSGMGLAMVHGFMNQIGGTARIYSEVDVGTSVKLYFPASDADLPDRVAAVTPGRPTGSHSVLLVEDQAEVRDTLRQQLERLGYRVTAAQSGDQALAIFLAGNHFDVVLTDIVMPGELQGPMLARRLRGLRADLPVVFMSGYPAEAAVNGNGLRPEDENLMKPVGQRELVAALQRALGMSG